jgi:hypothetical protein
MNTLETKVEESNPKTHSVLKAIFYSIGIAVAAFLFFGTSSFVFRYGLFAFSMAFLLFGIFAFVALFINLHILDDTKKKRFLLPVFCILLMALIYILLISERGISLLQWLNPVFLLVYFPILLLIMSWLLLVIFTRQLKDPAYSRISYIVLHCLIFLILYVVTFLGGVSLARYRADIFVEKTKQKAQIIIDKIEEYHRTHNTYPETLKEIGFSKEFCKLSEINSKIRYWKKLNTYIIEFPHPLGFLNYWAYDPKTKEWFPN